MNENKFRAIIWTLIIEVSCWEDIISIDELGNRECFSRNVMQGFLYVIKSTFLIALRRVKRVQVQST